ncbi:MAG: SEC-C domain-containing protein, partial [Planctomycetes bacterium]|nr:SEC-C domain-containing protein [Planctomycetota bacterium]
MPHEAYEPCPCGSGKKFKFCCYEAAEEIQRVQKLRENNQSRAALSVVERVERRSPDLPWASIARGSILLEERSE